MIHCWLSEVRVGGEMKRAQDVTYRCSLLCNPVTLKANEGGYDYHELLYISSLKEWKMTLVLANDISLIYHNSQSFFLRLLHCIANMLCKRYYSSSFLYFIPISLCKSYIYECISFKLNSQSNLPDVRNDTNENEKNVLYHFSLILICSSTLHYGAQSD